MKSSSSSPLLIVLSSPPQSSIKSHFLFAAPQLPFGLVSSFLIAAVKPSYCYVTRHLRLSRYLHLRLLLLTLRNCQVSTVLIFFNSYKLSEPLIAFLSLSLECHSQLLLHLQIFTFFCRFVELCLSFDIYVSLCFFGHPRRSFPPHLLSLSFLVFPSNRYSHMSFERCQISSSFHIILSLIQLSDLLILFTLRPNVLFCFFVFLF